MPKMLINLRMAQNNHEHISTRHVESNLPTPTNTSWQPESTFGSVVEDAIEHTSWGKSRCERMCCFPNTGGLHCTSGDAPLETPTLRNSASWQQPESTCGMREGSVVEDAIEHTSWGKSRCERMCCFPNTGGLHRTSGDAPLETPTLRNPAWCHVNRSKSLSSRRTQLAGVAYRHIPHESVRHSTKHRRGLNADRK
jgi:hypothetical protein